MKKNNKTIVIIIVAGMLFILASSFFLRKTNQCNKTIDGIVVIGDHLDVMPACIPGLLNGFVSKDIGF